MTLRVKSRSALGRLGIRLTPAQRKSLQRPPRTATERSPPQAALWALVRPSYPDAVSEFAGAVPGRRFTLDIALPSLRLAIEVDGWQHHGKYKSDFLRDREKDRALLLAGWRVARFTAGEIIKDRELVLTTLSQIVACLRAAGLRPEA